MSKLQLSLYDTGINAMKHAGIVQAEEIETCRDLFSQALASLQGQAIPMRSMSIQCVSQSWGALHIGRSVLNTPLQLAGRTYASGLGTHGDSEIRCRFRDKSVRRLQGLAGVNDSFYTRRKVKGLVFTLEVNGANVWQSSKQLADSAPGHFAVDLGNAREFTLKVNGPAEFAHANWVNLIATLTDGSTFDVCHPSMRFSDWQGPCLSFTCGGRPSAEFLPHWDLTEEQTATSRGGILRRLTRTDPETGLQLVIDLIAYPDFPVIEWVGRFRNTGKHNTPIIANIHSMDMLLPSWPSDVLLHYNTGDYCASDGYEPHCVTLASGMERSFAPDGGRPTNRAWPYYNLEFPEQCGGVIAVIGWPGQWASRIACQKDGVHVIAGQELTHFSLRPGEEVRTPVSVLLFYHGDHARSQNIWRRWMMACNLPRRNGDLHPPFLTAFWDGVVMDKADEQSQIKYLNQYAKKGVQLDYWWMDAGWYPGSKNWYSTGTWEVDRKRFPRGLGYIADHARDQRVKTLVWFEPERVCPNTRLWREHPEWLLDAKPEECKKHQGEKLLDLGNPEAWRWLVANTCKLIEEEKIGLYRQDFNFDPLPYWRHNEEPDRVGIREIRHVEGYLAFWRELRKRYPDMLIDSCAAGGRRNDLETLRLAVPLWKTDYDMADLTTKQAMHQALFAWVPFFGSSVVHDERSYSFRSNMCPCLHLIFNVTEPHLNWDEIRRFVGEWRRIALYLSGDYYPLTPYTRDEAHWMAWQFDRPDLGEGMIQGFRRKDSPFETACFRLRGLDSAATYCLVNQDHAHKPFILSGKELSEHGLRLTIEQAPQALTIIYRRQIQNKYQ